MSSQASSPAARQKGNALWFLLIGIVLLGAITMIVSRSGTSVEQSGDVEQSRIRASQIMRHAKSLGVGAEKLILNGCSENEISFENATVAVYGNTVNPDNESCFLFSAKGAGLTWQSFSSADLAGGEDVVVTAAVNVLGVGADEAGAAGADLVAFIQTTSATCLQVNREIGISTTPADIGSDVNAYAAPFTGTFAAPAFEIGNATGPELHGHPSGCMIDGNGDYVLYHVLLGR